LKFVIVIVFHSICLFISFYCVPVFNKHYAGRKPFQSRKEAADVEQDAATVAGATFKVIQHVFLLSSQNQILS